MNESIIPIMIKATTLVDKFTCDMQDILDELEPQVSKEMFNKIDKEFTKVVKKTDSLLDIMEVIIKNGRN
jgi:hypothetical protein